MAESKEPPVGVVRWLDMTSEDADEARAFYEEVVGWQSSSVDMEGYDDFNMHLADGGDPIAGICHARASNAELPRSVWLVYIAVEDLDRSLERCEELGGEVLVEPRGVPEYGRYAVIRDPVGAVVALGEFG